MTYAACLQHVYGALGMMMWASKMIDPVEQSEIWEIGAYQESTRKLSLSLAHPDPLQVLNPMSA
jgi:hypothetical protein